jgi:hypothetical protein
MVPGQTLGIISAVELLRMLILVYIYCTVYIYCMEKLGSLS